MAASTTNWFTSEIQQMMFGFGDVRRPLHETAVLVEEIVHQQMTQVLHQAMEVAQMRNNRFIGMEDVVFLLRKSPVKLGRLARYMDAKDKKAALVRAASVEDEEGAADLAEKPQAPKKRKKAIADFLATIDQTGELLAALDDDKVDEVKHERLMRAEMQARSMDPQQYLEFCQARQTNFSRRYKSQRFKDWLMSNLHLELKPNPQALEVISYLAYETVAEVVDLALIVRQTRLLGMQDAVTEKQKSATVFNYQDAWLLPALAARANPHPAQAGTPTQETAAVPGTSATPATTATGSATATSTSSATSTSASSTSTAAASPTKASKSKKRKRSASSPDALQLQAILPSDVQEAMRRFHAHIGPLTTIVRVNRAFPCKKRLLCA